MNAGISRTGTCIKLGILDGHPVVREGLENVLAEMVGIELVVNVPTLDKVLEHLGNGSLDVLLLGSSIGLSATAGGFRTIGALLNLVPKLKILLLSESDNERDANSALAEGARGYLLKSCNRYQIQAAIKAAHQNITVVAPGNLLAASLSLVQVRSTPVLKPLLTEREIDILTKVADGKSNKEIGLQLHLSETTVKKYCHNAMAKLGKRSRGGAALEAMRQNLIAVGQEPDRMLLEG